MEKNKYREFLLGLEGVFPNTVYPIVTVEVSKADFEEFNKICFKGIKQGSVMMTPIYNGLSLPNIGSIKLKVKDE